MGLWNKVKKWLGIEPKYFRANWQYLSGGPNNPDAWGNRAPTKQELIYAFNDIVYSIVDVKAQAVACVPIKLYTTQPQTRQKALPKMEINRHPLINLLKRPNPYHTLSQLMHYISTYLDVSGNAYLHMHIVDGEPIGLYLLPAQFVTPLKEQGRIVAFEYQQQDTQKVTYPSEEVIHFAASNLYDPYFEGVAPFAMAWERVKLSTKEVGYWNASLDNSGRPDSVLIPSEDIGVEDAERIQKEYYAQMTKRGTGGPLVLPTKFELRPLMWAPRDLAESDLFKQIKIAVCMSFKVPPDIFEIGMANRSSADAVLYEMALYAVKPRLSYIVEVLNHRLVPFWNGDIFLESDNPVPEDRQYELQKVTSLVTSGIITRDEARQEEGYPSADWAREALLPPGVLPASFGADFQQVNQEVQQVNQEVQDISKQIAQIRKALADQVAEVKQLAERPEPKVDLVPITEQLAKLQERLANLQTPSPTTKENTLTVPDIRQAENWDCGVAASMSVAHAFGVGTEDYADWVELLEATPATGTRPGAIVSMLDMLGLTTEARDKMELVDLAEAVDNNKLVICCANSHWYVVYGITDQVVQVQDPALGKAEIPLEDWVRQWKDTDADGKVYDHYGIIVGQRSYKAYRFKQRLPQGKSPTQLIGAIRRFYEQQAGQVLDKVKAIDSIQTKALNEWFNINEVAQNMLGFLLPVVETYYDYATQQTMNRIGASPELKKVVQPKLQEAMQQATMEFCLATQQTTHLQIDQAVSQLKQQLAEGMSEGEYKNQLKNRVQQVFTQASTTQAYLIGQTEANRAQHAAQQMVAQESGLVTGKRWLASANACPKCLPLNGRVVGLNENFAVLGSGPYGEVPHPPLHPGCVLGETPVFATGAFGATVANYHGPLVTVEFSNGDSFSCTPNHMLLTPYGFIRAADIVKGQDIVYCPLTEGMLNGVPNNNRKPTAIKEIVHSLAIAPGMATVSVPVSPEYLHGDGTFCEGNINVIAPASLLGDKVNIDIITDKQLTLANANVGGIEFPGDSEFATLLLTLSHATDSSMSIGRESQAFFLGELIHSGLYDLTHGTEWHTLFNQTLLNDSSANIVCDGQSKDGFPCQVTLNNLSNGEFYTFVRNNLLLGAKLNTRLKQMLLNRLVSNAKRISQALQSLTGKVTTYKVVSVKVDPTFSGHVYDLQTKSSLYIISNGIVSSNCMCTYTEVIPGVTD